jgi:hypothetical protein
VGEAGPTASEGYRSGQWIAAARPPQLALLDVQLRGHLGLVAAHLLDEPLCVLAPDEHLELDAEREVRR